VKLLFRWELLEHIVEILCELLDVLVCVRRQISAVRTTPKQLLGVTIEDVDNDIPDLRDLSSRCRHAIAAAEASPAPSAAEAVIEGIERLLIPGASKCTHRCIPVRVDLGPTLCGKLGIHVLLDSLIPE
jgi:hypothetical protein